VDAFLGHVFEILLRHDGVAARVRLQQVVGQHHPKSVHGLAVGPGDRRALERDLRHLPHDFLLDDVTVDAFAPFLVELEYLVDDILRVCGERR
jgi:hypothetical protein